MKNRILVVAAHPDDEILGCGATLSKYIKKGDTAYALILGEGIVSRDENKKSENEKKISALRRIAFRANSLLGVKKVFTCSFPDNRFDTVGLLDIIKAIEKVKQYVRPDIVFTHHKGDLNVDHMTTYKAVLTACRPMENETVKRIYSFEVPSSTEWTYPIAFTPNLFEDVSDTISDKLRALEMYKTEMRKFPHPRSREYVITNARKWAGVAGLQMAEAFEAIRIISTDRKKKASVCGNAGTARSLNGYERNGEKEITLRNAADQDSGFLWSWRNHPRIRKNFFDPDPVSWNDHKRWFDLKMKDPNVKIYIAQIEDERIGVIRFKSQDSCISVSVNLNPNFLGKGLGHKVIELGTDKVLKAAKGSKPVIAEIKEKNIISQKAFAKAGYTCAARKKRTVVLKREI